MRNKGLKITALVLVISLLAAVFAFSAFAAETPEIAIGSGEAKAGEEVSIDVKVKNFKAVAGIQLNIEYGNLEFKELTSDKLTDLTRGTDYSAENGRLRLVGVGDVDSNYQMNGAINTDDEVVAFTVKFTVPSGAVADTVYDIKFAANGNNFSDSDEQLFTVNKSNGKVTVKGDYLVGDINGDGKVTKVDRTILSRYLAKWPDYATLPNAEAADINKDGKVTKVDRTILSRYLAKWPNYNEYFE